MEATPEFLEPDVVPFMHDQALRAYGGTQGLKGEDLLHSALSRSESRWHDAGAERPDFATLAAAYAYGIARNHPFNDANKQTGWSCWAFASGSMQRKPLRPWSRWPKET